ncbi:MAG: efflux RND transporter periplasmic adaptor subunit, partial [Proteobacteria bacterium]
MASGKARIGVLAVLGAVALGLVGWALFPKSSPPARAPAAPVTSVVTAPVEQRDFPVVLNALGQAQGWQTVTVRAEVSGRLL